MLRFLVVAYPPPTILGAMICLVGLSGSAPAAKADEKDAPPAQKPAERVIVPSDLTDWKISIYDKTVRADYPKPPRVEVDSSGKLALDGIRGRVETQMTKRDLQEFFTSISAVMNAARIVDLSREYKFSHPRYYVLRMEHGTRAFQVYLPNHQLSQMGVHSEFARVDELLEAPLLRYRESPTYDALKLDASYRDKAAKQGRQIVSDDLQKWGYVELRMTSGAQTDYVRVYREDLRMRPGEIWVESGKKVTRNANLDPDFRKRCYETVRLVLNQFDFDAPSAKREGEATRLKIGICAHEREITAEFADFESLPKEWRDRISKLVEEAKAMLP